MQKCPACDRARFWQLADGRLKCRACGHRFRAATPAWNAVRLSTAQKRRLIERFVLGVPVYRQRFHPVCSAATAEKFYRLLRACCAHAEHWREPLTGALECDETTFGGARHGKRGWGAAGKVIVFGIIKRNGQVKAMPIARHDR
jgi:transposase